MRLRPIRCTDIDRYTKRTSKVPNKSVYEFSITVTVTAYPWRQLTEILSEWLGRNRFFQWGTKLTKSSFANMWAQTLPPVRPKDVWAEDTTIFKLVLFSWICWWITVSTEETCCSDQIGNVLSLWWPIIILSVVRQPRKKRLWHKSRLKTGFWTLRKKRSKCQRLEIFPFERRKG